MDPTDFYRYPSPMDSIWEQQQDIASGCQYKEIDDLTPEEKVAICFCAGVPMRLDEGPDGQQLLTTRYVVGFQKVGDSIRVYVDPTRANLPGWHLTKKR